MTNATLRKKILDLQAELELIQRRMDKKPDPKIDELIWRKVRPEAKKARKGLYRRRYGKGTG